MTYITAFYNFMQSLFGVMPAAITSFIIAVFAFFMLFGVLRMLFR